MNDHDLKELLAIRRKDNLPGDKVVRLLLKKELNAVNQPIEDHAVRWSADAWIGAEPWSKDTRGRLKDLRDHLERDGSGRMISRADVFDRRGDPLDLFLAAMAWGFGDRGYGWYRTATVINTAGEARVARAVETLQRAAEEGGSAGTWKAWSRGGVAKLPGLGTAFASKVAYFACFDRTTGRGPLIADINTAWAFWALHGCWDSRSSAARYAAYVEWAQNEADGLECRPDDIERALFMIGPAVYREWKR